MSERERLAACPLCGGNAYFDERNPAECDGVCTVRCINCGLSLPIFAGPLSKQTAITAWNRRASAPPADVAPLVHSMLGNADAILNADETAFRLACANALAVQAKQAADALAALARERDRLMAVLADPNAVHINLLRGDIARPTWRQIKHVYAADVAEEDRARAALGGNDAG